MTALAYIRPEIVDIGNEVAKSIASSTPTAIGAFVNTPLLYPGGGSVVVKIDGSRSRFIVSDYGAGCREASMIDAGHSFAIAAGAIAHSGNMKFDGRAILLENVSKNDLIGAVIAVANASQLAVRETFMRHEERKVDQERIDLVARLSSVFGKSHVEHDLVFRGASSIEWPIVARVKAMPVDTLFDYAKPHHASVTNIAAKFHDIARLEMPPRRVVSVRNREAMGKFLGLLSQAASVIEAANIPDESLRHLAVIA